MISKVPWRTFGHSLAIEVNAWAWQACSGVLAFLSPACADETKATATAVATRTFHTGFSLANGFRHCSEYGFAHPGLAHCLRCVRYFVTTFTPLRPFASGCFFRLPVPGNGSSERGLLTSTTDKNCAATKPANATSLRRFSRTSPPNALQSKQLSKYSGQKGPGA